jgi:hypothetical protein
MILKYLHLEWKSFIRSSAFAQDLGVKIFLGLVALLMLASFFLVGISFYGLMEKQGQDPFPLINANLLSWIGAELLYRFFLQTLPVMNIRPWLVQPVAKNTLVHQILSLSLFSFYNLPSLLFFLPFGFSAVKNGALTWPQLLTWWSLLLGVLLCIHYLNFLIKKKFTEDIKKLLPLALLLVGATLSDRMGWLPLGHYCKMAVDTVLDHPILATASWLGAISLYLANYRYLKKGFYLDGHLTAKKEKVQVQEMHFLDFLGEMAPYIKLDVKLIWRNKRPRTTVFLALFMLAYGLIFYTNPSYANSAVWKLFVGIFMTGIFMINFGQFIPAWDSSYYPLMMAQNIPLEKYLRSKVVLMQLSIIILYVGTLAYMYFGPEVLLINTACAIYNLGINIPIMLTFGAWNKKRIDLEKTVFMNYQGTGAAQWVVGIPVLALPLLIWKIMETYTSFTAATLTLIGLGLLGLATQNIWLRQIAQLYQQKKHITLDGFKQKD